MTHPRDESTSASLVFKTDFLPDEAASTAYAKFLVDVFDDAPSRPPTPDPRWQVFGWFDQGGACVAGVEASVLTILLDGAAAEMAIVRLAGVDKAHRGRGLFRDLMEKVLASQGADRPVLLFSANPALYARFSFMPLAQHAFVGAAPNPTPGPTARHLDIGEALTILDRIMPGRAPISKHCAVLGAADLLRANLQNVDLHLAFVEIADALVILDADEDDLVVVDIVGSALPTMSEIVGAVRPEAKRVRTLFPPDRLAWHGTPEPDEAGLMIRGRPPPAMRRPFMLPPTVSF